MIRYAVLITFYFPSDASIQLYYTCTYSNLMSSDKSEETLELSPMICSCSYEICYSKHSECRVFELQ